MRPLPVGPWFGGVCVFSTFEKIMTWNFVGVIRGPLWKIFGKKVFRNFSNFSKKNFALPCLGKKWKKNCRLARAKIFNENFEKLFYQKFFVGVLRRPPQNFRSLYLKTRKRHIPPQIRGLQMEVSLCPFNFTWKIRQIASFMSQITQNQVNLTSYFQNCNLTKIFINFQVPRVFIKGECIGGGSEASAADSSGDLEKRLKAAGAI